MDYRPNPLLYGVNKDFFSTFRIVITLESAVDHKILSQAVTKAMKRYPYFCVYPVKEANSLLLRENPHPVPVFEDDRNIELGSAACNGHLLTFGCHGRRIILNASHYIADGMGIFPLLLSVLYLYVAQRYGTEGLNPAKIHMPDDPVQEEEYVYPFFDTPVEIDDSLRQRKIPKQGYLLDSGVFDEDGLFAYHLRIPQKAFMEKAAPSDGSPISFLSVMMYRALCSLDKDISQPVVVHVQHQYRSTLKMPGNRHSLVSYIPVAFPPKMKDWNLELQNTVIRGQIIVGSEPEEDLRAINRLISVFPADKNMSLTEKEISMQQYIDSSIQGKTCGISYVGKIDWCGLDRYMEDIHAYIGEKNTRNMLLIEVMTMGEDFSINFMQSGAGSYYVDAFIEQLQACGIPACIVGADRYTLCDTKIPTDSL